jgi:hypothetical protein
MKCAKCHSARATIRMDGPLTVTLCDEDWVAWTTSLARDECMRLVSLFLGHSHPHEDNPIDAQVDPTQETMKRILSKYTKGMRKTP